MHPSYLERNIKKKKVNETIRDHNAHSHQNFCVKQFHMAISYTRASLAFLQFWFLSQLSFPCCLSPLIKGMKHAKKKREVLGKR